MEVVEMVVKLNKCDFTDCKHNTDGKCTLPKIKIAQFRWVNSKTGEYTGVCLSYESITTIY